MHIIDEVRTARPQPKALAGTVARAGPGCHVPRRSCPRHSLSSFTRSRSGVQYSLKTLLTKLEIGNLLTAWSAVLFERQVVVHSSDYSLLTPVCEALLSLIFPFQRVQVFIPVLPQALLEFVQATRCGIDSSRRDRTEALAWPARSCLQPSVPSRPRPKRLRRAIVSTDG